MGEREKKRETGKRERQKPACLFRRTSGKRDQELLS